MEPLQSVIGAWLEKIKLGHKKKAERFGMEAEEGMRFFTGPYDFLYTKGASLSDRHFRQTRTDDDFDEIPPPQFQMTYNKSAELVQLFGPVLYHRNPIRQVNPREQPVPPQALLQMAAQNPQFGFMMQQLLMQAASQKAIDETRATLIQHLLNYTPNALDLKTESRWGIDEGLIKGAGYLWTETYRPPGAANMMVGSFHDTADNLIKDPDATGNRNMRWCARRRTEPVWFTERKFGLPVGSIKGNMESYSQQAGVSAAGSTGTYWRAVGETSDMITYWEIYSKCGLGGRLSGTNDWSQTSLEVFGDYCYLAICEGYAYPLNVPQQLWQLPYAQAVKEISRRVAWPTPFWADDAWPFAELAFHSIPNDPWPMSHLSPAMGELKFLNWMFSYLAGKIRITSRDFIVIAEGAGDDLKQTLLHGQDFELIKLKQSHGKAIQDVVQFLQHPQFNGDVWKVIEAVANNFDRRTGLTELMYGQSARQLRSASEATLKHDAMSVRPDEMANKVEDWMAQAARLEALASRWHLKGKDVAPVMGPVGESLWNMFVVPSNPAEILYQLEYRIEAGSARKPNKERDAANYEKAMQVMGPFLQQAAMAGFPDPWNTLAGAWCKSIDLDPKGLLLMPPGMGGPFLGMMPPVGTGQAPPPGAPPGPARPATAA